MLRRVDDSVRRDDEEHADSGGNREQLHKVLALSFGLPVLKGARDGKSIVPAAVCR